MGMLRATRILDRYAELDFGSHPDVTMCLMVASLEREGKATEWITSKLDSLRGVLGKAESTIASLDVDIKKLKKKNPEFFRWGSSKWGGFPSFLPFLENRRDASPLPGVALSVPISRTLQTGEVVVNSSSRTGGRRGRIDIRIGILGDQSLSWTEAAIGWGVTVEALVCNHFDNQ